MFRLFTKIIFRLTTVKYKLKKELLLKPKYADNVVKKMEGLLMEFSGRNKKYLIYFNNCTVYHFYYFVQ